MKCVHFLASVYQIKAGLEEDTEHEANKFQIHFLTEKKNHILEISRKRNKFLSLFFIFLMFSILMTIFFFIYMCTFNLYCYLLLY